MAKRSILIIKCHTVSVSHNTIAIKSFVWWYPIPATSAKIVRVHLWYLGDRVASYLANSPLLLKLTMTFLGWVAMLYDTQWWTTS